MDTTTLLIEGENKGSSSSTRLYGHFEREKQNYEKIWMKH